VAAVARDREERDLITTVLYGRLRNEGPVRYRQHADSTLFLRAERHTDGRRTYKLQ